MAAVMIGVDPHKGSHTAVAISPAEECLGELRVRASAGQAEQLLAWAVGWPERAWAIEGAGGLGHLLAQQLLAAGEQVLDVQPKLGARVRLPRAAVTIRHAGRHSHHSRSTPLRVGHPAPPVRTASTASRRAAGQPGRSAAVNTPIPPPIARVQLPGRPCAVRAVPDCDLAGRQQPAPRHRPAPSRPPPGRTDPLAQAGAVFSSCRVLQLQSVRRRGGDGLCRRRERARMTAAAGRWRGPAAWPVGPGVHSANTQPRHHPSAAAAKSRQ
jgi:hypothetical protein